MGMEMEVETEVETETELSSFQSRVSRVFGGLSSDLAAPAASLWTIGDRRQQVEPERQNPSAKREGGDEDSGSESDEAQPDAEAEAEEGEDEDDEVEQMRMMIGMDATLDFEDEEDEYDKVAVGREGAGDRIYMKEIHASRGMQSSLASLPGSVCEMKLLAKDFRANHQAAAARLAEDARDAAAQTIITSSKANSKLEVQIESKIRPALKSAKRNIQDKTHSLRPLTGVTYNNSGQDETIENSSDFMGCAPAKKRVRFADDSLPSHAGMVEEEELSSVPSTIKGSEALSHLSNASSDNMNGRGSKVPDYVRYPWKYIHYTLDWSDDEAEEEKKNLEGFQALRENIQAPKESSEGLIELPKTILFSHRHKLVREGNQSSLNQYDQSTNADKLSHLEDTKTKKLPVGIAAGIDNEPDSHLLQNDDFSSPDADMVSVEEWPGGVRPSSLQRKYRSKTNQRDVESPD